MTIGKALMAVGEPAVVTTHSMSGLMIRMLIVAYCYGIRSERKLCEEVELHLAYRCFCRLDLDDEVPDHSTFSINRHGRFRASDIFWQIFEAVVRAHGRGLVKGEGFAVDASVTTPAVIMARLPTRSTGRYPSARRAPLRSS
jgi:IS5 family transposase